MENPGNWALGFCAAILGLGGLFVSAGAGGSVGYYGGLAIFAFGVLFILHLIRIGTAKE